MFVAATLAFSAKSYAQECGNGLRKLCCLDNTCADPYYCHTDFGFCVGDYDPTDITDGCGQGGDEPEPCCTDGVSMFCDIGETCDEDLGMCMGSDPGDEPEPDDPLLGCSHVGDMCCGARPNGICGNSLYCLPEPYFVCILGNPNENPNCGESTQNCCASAGITYCDTGSGLVCWNDPGAPGDLGICSTTNPFGDSTCDTLGDDCCTEINREPFCDDPSLECESLNGRLQCVYRRNRVTPWNPSEAIDVAMVVKTGFSILIPLSVILGIFLIILNGYKLLTSQGDPRNVQEAREGLTSAIIGIIFVVLSIVILRLIIGGILGFANAIPF